MKIEKILGCMIGLACGDALGVPVEFKSREAIYEEFGVIENMVGGGTWGKPAGTVSDDTEMALCVAEGIIENPKDPVPSIGERFVRWYENEPFDVGVCCSIVIARMLGKKSKKADWFRESKRYAAESNGRCCGNGGLMRTAYVGVFYNNLKDVKCNAYDICKMTHNNIDVCDDCSMVSTIIHELIEGGTKETIESIVLGDKRSDVYDLGDIEGYPFMVKPTGYSVNSLKCALKCVLTTRSFKDAVVMAVNMGGDTDTIGAITGAIAGALYGVEGIPEEWINALDDDAFDRIIHVSMMGAVNRMGGYENVVSRIREWNKEEVQTGNEGSDGCGYE